MQCCGGAFSYICLFASLMWHNFNGCQVKAELIVVNVLEKVNKVGEYLSANLTEFMGAKTNTPGNTAHLKAFKDSPNKTMLLSRSNLHRDLILAIGSGVELAYRQCKENFKWERWNCTELAFSRRYLSPLTREMAYVASITAAGISHAVAKFCFKGSLLPDCSCKKKDGSSNETECLGNLKTGHLVAREFLNSADKRAQDLIASINSHNYEIGLKANELNAGEECKCHGLSGSCTTKTCWKKIPPFPLVGNHLKAAYNRGMKVAVNRNNFGNGFQMTERFPNLLYMDDSPDYCKPDVAQGWYGTEDRICSRRKGGNVTDLSERKSCKELCKDCGHQVRWRTVRVAWRCNCKFSFCCGITCNICVKKKNENYCLPSPKDKRLIIGPFGNFSGSNRRSLDPQLF